MLRIGNEVKCEPYKRLRQCQTNSQCLQPVLTSQKVRRYFFAWRRNYSAHSHGLLVNSFRSYAGTVVSVSQEVPFRNTPTHKGRLPERHFAILTNVALPSGHYVQETKPVHQIKTFWSLSGCYIFQLYLTRALSNNRLNYKDNLRACWVYK